MMYERIYQLSNDNRYLRVARALENAIYQVYKEKKVLTPDVGGNATTDDLINEVFNKLS